MIRKINRVIQDALRPVRLRLGRVIWDRKEKTNCSCDKIIESNRVKSVLFLRCDGKIGDMVVNTMMFREIKRYYPNIKIGVVTRGAARDIIANNPNVNEIYNFDKNPKKMKKLAEKIAEEKYDLLVDFSEMLRVRDMEFINRCKAKINLGLDKREWKLFDCSVEPEKDFKWDEHITKRYGAYLEKMGIFDYSTTYDVYINPERKERASEYFKKLKKECPGCSEIVVLNPYGASKHRTLNSEKICEILRVLSEKNYISVLICPKDKYEELSEILDTNKIKNVFLPNSIRNILDSSAIIKESDLVITPDTSVVHIASAFKKPMIAIYRKERGEENNSEVWNPNSPNAKIIFARENFKSGKEIDINSFDIQDLKKEIENR